MADENATPATPGAAQPSVEIPQPRRAVTEPVFVAPTDDPVAEPFASDPIPARADEPAQRVEPVETAYAAPVVEPVETASAEPVAEPTPAQVPVETEVISASSEPETVVFAETTPPAHTQEVIVVDAPVPPRRHGNRLAGLGLVFAGSIVLAALLAGVEILFDVIAGDPVDVAFLTEPLFYAPVALFFVASLLIIAIVNTAGWWTYIITSVLIAAAVYFGTAGVALLEAGVTTLTQAEANTLYFEALAQPATIAAALLAREVAIWTGAILGRRGRRVRARNAEEREAFEREQAELIPTA